jgi:hypothetical protein
MLRLRLAHDGSDVDAERFGCPALRSIPGDRMLDDLALIDAHLRLEIEGTPGPAIATVRALAVDR